MKNSKKAPAVHAVKRYRERMREQGFRLLQLWVPDTHASMFMAECRRQSRLIANAEKQHDINDWVNVATKQIEGWK